MVMVNVHWTLHTSGGVLGASHTSSSHNSHDTSYQHLFHFKAEATEALFCHTVESPHATRRAELL